MRRGDRRGPAARPAPAALLRRVDREPQPARLHAARARLPRLRGRGRDGARPPRDRRAGPADEEGGQRGDARSSADARSTRSTCASAASTARRRAPSCARCVDPLERGARDRARDGRAGRRRSSSPTSSARPSCSRCPSPATLPDRPAAGSSPTRGLRHRAGGVRRRTSSRSTSSTQTPCTRACASAARYLTGPLARYAPVRRRSCGRWRSEAAREAGLGPVCRNPFQSIVVRAVELVAGVRRGARAHRRATRSRMPRRWRSAAGRAVGHGATEAPRGLLYHRYEIDDDGTILDAEIVPPTSQNQLAIEEDLRAVVEARPRPARRAAVAALRAGDPQPRPLHLLRDPLPEADRRPLVASSSSVSATATAATTLRGSRRSASCATKACERPSSRANRSGCSTSGKTPGLRS